MGCLPGIAVGKLKTCKIRDEKLESNLLPVKRKCFQISFFEAVELLRTMICICYPCLSRVKLGNIVQTVNFFQQFFTVFNIIFWMLCG